MLLFATLLATASAQDDGMTLFDFSGDFDPSAINATDAILTATGDALRIETGNSYTWPGFTLPAPDGKWDLSKYAAITLELRNVGDNAVSVHCRIDNPGGDGAKNSLTRSVELQPGEEKTFRIDLTRPLPERLRGKLFGMRGLPGGLAGAGAIDSSNLTQMIIFVNQPSERHAYVLRAIRAVGESDEYKWAHLSADEFFPFIDRYGQFIYDEWVGKVHSDDDLHVNRRKEAADLAARPSPADWNEYGGWATGPQLDAAGFFRVEKRDGKWWLVDPNGRLFWSHGVDCVNTNNGSTPITDREFYFTDLPDDSPFHSWGQLGLAQLHEGRLSRLQLHRRESCPQ
ncbi:MAG: hypothetical protein O3A46_15395, partial [Candidatus Poribacteria bacterium]|nr:hypothetical protein [Candidatus Poribacteria bacterium]